MSFFYEINLYHVRTGDEEEVFLRNKLKVSTAFDENRQLFAENKFLSLVLRNT